MEKYSLSLSLSLSLSRPPRTLYPPVCVVVTAKSMSWFQYSELWSKWGDLKWDKHTANYGKSDIYEYKCSTVKERHRIQCMANTWESGQFFNKQIYKRFFFPSIPRSLSFGRILQEAEEYISLVNINHAAS